MTPLHNPPSMQWEMTAECNHDCLHCYNYWRKDFEKIAGMSKIKTEDEYFEIAKKIVEIKPVSVTITGGEPLLVFSKIRKSIDHLIDNGIVVSMNTNAALLNDEICSYIKEKNIRLFVSFICADPVVFDEIVNRKGAFDRVVKSLDMAYRYKLNFGNNIVVSSRTIDYLPMTIDFLRERYNANYISVTRVGKPINSDDSFNPMMLDHDGIGHLLDIVVDGMKRHPGLIIGTACPYTPCSINSQEAFDLYGYKKICTAGRTSFSIDTDGNFKACPRDSRLYGNILTDSFDEVYESMHEWRDGSFVPNECKSCKEYSRCLGGCRVDSIPFTGKSNCLDRISNPDNLPLRYHATSRRRDYGKKSFRLNTERVIVVKNDDSSYRLSSGRNYVIVTDKLYNFLASHSDGFTRDDLSRSFEKDENIANNAVGRLLAETIIRVV